MPVLPMSAARVFFDGIFTEPRLAHPEGVAVHRDGSIWCGTERGELIRIEADSLLRQIRESPEIAISILSATFVHLNSLVSQVETLKAQTGAQRVAEFLLELVKCPSGSFEVTLPYDKALIAGRLGMTPGAQAVLASSTSKASLTKAATTPFSTAITRRPSPS